MDRLQIDFSVSAAEIDESPRQDELPAVLVTRLAVEKAEAVAVKHPAAVVIGSDQLAIFRGRIIGKPGSVEAAIRQLSLFSGHCVKFLTAVAVVCHDSDYLSEKTVSTKVCFRQLEKSEIERYVAMDKPLDCAGGFKSESAGSALLASIQSDDPTAIIGLPLICLSSMLRQSGIQIP